MRQIIQQKIDIRLKKAKEKSKTNIKAAIQEYYQILFLDNKHLQSYKELAQLYFSIGDISPAISCLQLCQTIKYDVIVEDDLLQYIYLRGLSLLYAGDVNNFLEMSEYEQFGNYIDFTIKSLQKPYAYILTNQLKQSLEEVQKVIKEDPTNIDALLLRGKLYWSQGKHAEGNLDYWQVHQMQPDIQEVREFISYILPKTETIINETKFFIVQRDTDKCRLNVKKGLELYPNNKELLMIKAYLHRISHEYEQSLKDLDNALKQDLENIDIQKQIALTYNEMAMLLFERQNYEDALTLFSEALKYRPNDWGILLNRGDTYKQLNKLTETYGDYKAALLIDQNITVTQRMALILHSIGVDFFNKKKFQEAYTAFSQGLEQSESAEMYFKRGKCLIQLQKYGAALSDFQRSL
ncbi:hypothetical protein pb186bvf_017856 [Paramecium bursaria]